MVTRYNEPIASTPFQTYVSQFAPKNLELIERNLLRRQENWDKNEELYNQNKRLFNSVRGAGERDAAYRNKFVEDVNKNLTAIADSHNDYGSYNFKKAVNDYSNKLIADPNLQTLIANQGKYEQEQKEIAELKKDGRYQDYLHEKDMNPIGKDGNLTPYSYNVERGLLDKEIMEPISDFAKQFKADKYGYTKIDPVTGDRVQLGGGGIGLAKIEGLTADYIVNNYSHTQAGKQLLRKFSKQYGLTPEQSLKQMVNFATKYTKGGAFNESTSEFNYAPEHIYKQKNTNVVTSQVPLVDSVSGFQFTTPQGDFVNKTDGIGSAQYNQLLAEAKKSNPNQSTEEFDKAYLNSNKSNPTILSIADNKVYEQLAKTYLGNDMKDPLLAFSKGAWFTQEGNAVSPEDFGQFVKDELGVDDVKNVNTNLAFMPTSGLAPASMLMTASSPDGKKVKTFVMHPPKSVENTQSYQVLHTLGKSINDGKASYVPYYDDKTGRVYVYANGTNTRVKVGENSSPVLDKSTDVFYKVLTPKDKSITFDDIKKVMANPNQSNPKFTESETQKVDFDTLSKQMFKGDILKAYLGELPQ